MLFSQIRRILNSTPAFMLKEQGIDEPQSWSQFVIYIVQLIHSLDFKPKDMLLLM